jgi:hypothetical protein
MVNCNFFLLHCLFCLLQKIKFYTDVEQTAAIGIHCAESGHNTECNYVLVGIKYINDINLHFLD